MCECKKRLEDMTRDRLQQDLPEGSRDLSVAIKGYALVKDGSRWVTRQSAVAEVAYMAPKKGGGEKLVKEEITLVASHCMFCGEKYPKEKVDG